MMNPLQLFRLAALAALVAAVSASATPEKGQSQVEVVRIDHKVRQIEGWNVHVDVSLLEGDHKETGDLALRILGERLHQISLRLPAEPVARMKEVPIYLDRDHPLGNAHYHPDAGWLRDHGYDPAMAKAIQFTRAASLIREARSPNSTSVVLHELAHAYHDRVLGFDHPEILAGYTEFCDSRKFDNTAHISGRSQPHYGLTDHKEYFAEMTETFFVGNGYYPFNHYQLYQAHAPSYELIARIWGSEMKPPVADDSHGPGILDLRILATLMSQRGDFDEALALIAEAEKRSSDREGRIASLREKIEEQRAEASGLAFPIAAATPAMAPDSLGVAKVADGFERPVWAGMPKGHDDTLWVMEQAGRIWRVDLATGKRALEPFLDIARDVSRRGNEEGLLGLAFDAEFIETGIYYVNYSDHEQHTRIVRFTSADKKTTDPATAELILRFKQDFRNHNGGWIEFGPDGMLYIGNGDGGSGNDPNNRAQDLGSLLGKMLRIDVSGGGKGYKIPQDNPFLSCSNGMRPEIWFYGLRNPWRCSFDRETGDFWMGDVGQNRQEEINFMKAGEGAGANFGWRPREGAIATPTGPRIGGPRPESNVDPVYVYSHGNGPREGKSVTGGYVYRGPIESLRGRYVFADYINPRIWSFVLKAGEAADFHDLTDALQPEDGRINLISSFAEDNQGNLFIVDHTGPVYRIIQRQ